MLDNLFLISGVLPTNNLIIFIFALTIAIVALIVNLLKSDSVFESIFCLSAISSSIGILYLILDAPDVAMTEAAIGACLSTVILIQFGNNIKDSLSAKNLLSHKLIGLLAAGATFILFTKIGLELPDFGKDSNPIQVSLAAKHYIANTEREIGVPAFVAAILASYRGFDTLGETTVILIAGISVLLIMGGRDVAKK